VKPALSSLVAKADRSVLVKRCESLVASRQWASWDIWSPEPYYFERNQYGRGKKLARQPAPTKDAKLYGYDAAGRVVRLRSWSGFLERWHEDELFVWSDRELLAYRFQERDRLLNVHRYTFDGEARLVRHEIYFAEAKRTGEQRFVWTDGVLSRVAVKNWGHSWSLEHDELGRLTAIATVSNGRAFEIYRRPPANESLPALLDAIRERLREIAPRVVSKVRPSSPLYALALVVDEEEWRYALPPSLAFGFESPRTSREWDAAELFEPTTGWNDRRLAALCKRANQRVWQTGAHARVRALVRALARDLQQVDWPKLRAVTDDVVVYATSLEGGGAADARRARRGRRPASRR